MISGERIKNARKRKKLSQQELGDILGVSKVSICGYEKGTREPTLEKFTQLIEILNIGSDYALGRDISAVVDNDVNYQIKLSNEDVKIINEIKRNQKLYSKLKADPKRTIELIDRKLNK